MSDIEISCLDVSAKLQKGDQFLLLDCREQDEYDHVKIEQATLIPMSQLAERVSELEAYQNQEIVVHCHHGGRSLRVARWLLGQGFQNVKNMTGGIDEWSVSVDPELPRY